RDPLGRRCLPGDPAARIERPHAAPLRECGRPSPGWVDPGARARIRALGRHRCALRGAHGWAVVGARVDSRPCLAGTADPAAAMGATHAPHTRSGELGDPEHDRSVAPKAFQPVQLALLWNEGVADDITEIDQDPTTTRVAPECD